MFGFVFDIPLLIVGPVLVAGISALAAAGLIFMRRHILPRLRIADEDSDLTGTVVESIMVLYGLTVALVAVTVWQNYSEAATVVSQEATALAVLYRDVSAYPLPERTQLQDELREYVEYVIRDAWPKQRRGEVPREGIKRISLFEEILTRFEPATEGQRILHAETLQAYNRMLDVRRMRLDAVRAALPGIMWAVILFGAALGLIGSYFVRIRNPLLQMILVVLLAIFIAMVIFVVLAFDRPFRGSQGIGPEHYQLVYDQLMKR